MFHSVSLLSQALLAHGSRALPSIYEFVLKKKFLNEHRENMFGEFKYNHLYMCANEHSHTPGLSGLKVLPTGV